MLGLCIRQVSAGGVRVVATLLAGTGPNVKAGAGGKGRPCDPCMVVCGRCWRTAWSLQLATVVGVSHRACSGPRSLSLDDAQEIQRARELLCA